MTLFRLKFNQSYTMADGEDLLSSASGVAKSQTLTSGLYKREVEFTTLS